MRTPKTPNWRQEPLREAYADLPSPARIALALAFSAMAAYYIVQVLLCLLGQPTYILFDWVGLAVTAGALMVPSVIGLVLGRVMLVGVAFSGLGLAFILWMALHGSGDLLGWARQVLFYLLLPLVNAALLTACQRAWPKD